MKKILFLIICLALLFSVFTTAVFAENTDVPAQAEEAENNLFTRVFEYLSANAETVIGYFADGVVLAVALLTAKFGKGLTAKLTGLISKGASEDTQSKLVEGFNSLLSENEELKNQLEALKLSVENANSELMIVHKETKAVLESMFNVWGHSSNLPQCLKELVAAQYAACVKAEGGDGGAGENA